MKPPQHRALSFRQSRAIDYSSVRVMRQRAREKQLQREHVQRAGRFVVGRFVLRGGCIVLAAVRREVTFNIDPRAPLTMNPLAMALWVTKQAARQWLLRNPRPGCHLVNVDRLHDPQLADVDVAGVAMRPARRKKNRRGFRSPRRMLCSTGGRGSQELTPAGEL